MIDDKWIGLALAGSSSLLIGISFIITKKGLLDTSARHGSASDGLNYLKNPTWWIGMATMALGEIANFAAYSFAPAILVTPLGALSVLISSLLASWLLKERLGTNGKVGSLLCLLGAVVIVLHAPEDKEIESVDEILAYAIKPGFLIYCLFVLIFTIFMIHRVVPKYGRRSVLVYISICSLVGSVSVMAVKAFGIALKLTLSGSNQLTHLSTYVFAAVVAIAIATQMNYFNKALDTFSTNLVTPIYYVCFTTATIIASTILFQGFNDTGVVDTISILCGFTEIFIGVFLLNEQRVSGDATPTGRRGSILRLGSGPNTPGLYQAPGVGPVPSRRRRSGHRRSHSSSISGYAAPVILDDLLEDEGAEAIGSGRSNTQRGRLPQVDEESQRMLTQHQYSNGTVSDETVITVEEDQDAYFVAKHQPYTPATARFDRRAIAEEPAVDEDEEGMELGDHSENARRLSGRGKGYGGFQMSDDDDDV